MKKKRKLTPEQKIKARRAADRAHYKKNRVKRLAAQRAIYKKNREAILARQKKWRDANPEKVKGYAKKATDQRRAVREAAKKTTNPTKE